MESFKLDEVTKSISVTNHMWSGFNQLAHLATWRKVPDDMKAVIERNVATYVRLQRQDQERANVEEADRGRVLVVARVSGRLVARLNENALALQTRLPSSRLGRVIVTDRDTCPANPETRESSPVAECCGRYRTQPGASSHQASRTSGTWESVSCPRDRRNRSDR